MHSLFYKKKVGNIGIVCSCYMIWKLLLIVSEMCYIVRSIFSKVELTILRKCCKTWQQRLRASLEVPRSRADSSSRSLASCGCISVRPLFASGYPSHPVSEWVSLPQNFCVFEWNSYVIDLPLRFLTEKRFFISPLDKISRINCIWGCWKCCITDKMV